MPAEMRFGLVQTSNQCQATPCICHLCHLPLVILESARANFTLRSSICRVNIARDDLSVSKSSKSHARASPTNRTGVSQSALTELERSIQSNLAFPFSVTGEADLLMFSLPPVLSIISCTSMSMPTQNFFPLHSTCEPPQNAHNQIGRLSASRPNHDKSHSPKGRCALFLRAKNGVCSSTSMDALLWSLR